MFVVMVIERSSGTSMGLDIDLSNKETGIVGMIPVFEKREQAEEYSNGAKVYEIEEAK